MLIVGASHRRESISCDGDERTAKGNSSYMGAATPGLQNQSVPRSSSSRTCLPYHTGAADTKSV